MKQSKFYSKVEKESTKKGIEKGKVEGKAEGKVETALAFIRNGLVSLEAVIETLQLSPAEVAAIQALLQQSSNGNRSNGNHHVK